MIVAYCVKCKASREMARAEAVFTEAGRPAVRGECPVCGTTLFRFGASPLHEGMAAPEPKPRAPKSAASNGRATKTSAAKKSAAKKGATKKGAAKKKPTRKAAGKANGKAPGAAAGRAKRGTKLVIVESPAKARTIGKFLGAGYDVRASLGHVRDLLKSRLSVDVEQGFGPTYRVPTEKKELIKELAAAARKASEVWLATDPDREGEAIAWHLMEAAEIAPDQARRVVFHEITPKAIQESFAHPRALDMQLVDAQQARRILDRLVGFNLSPLLWKKVRGRLSAGRVQSVALRMVVERERAVRDFVPQEYWTIEAVFEREAGSGKRGAGSNGATTSHIPHPTSHTPHPIRARLHRVGGEEPGLANEAEAEGHVAALQGASYRVAEVRRAERRRRPSAPFTTSTLQQEASRRLGFGTQRTMALAQALYEGIPIGDEGTVGLITYMRTDSVSVAREAADEARAFVAERFGAAFVPAEPPTYKTRAQRAQEAHEAIRPTSVRRTPEAMKPFLEAAQWRLYALVWQRFVASQMENALLDQTTVDIAAEPNTGTPNGRDGSATRPRADAPNGGDGTETHPYLFRASGSVVRFAGFQALYEESRDEDEPEPDAATLPDLAAGEALDAVDLAANQHFTQPPPRFTEATLVRALEENGIGRPSTYAPTVNTLTARGYAERDAKRLVPTELGEIVTDLLVEHFPDVLDVGFTAQMEDELDEIAEGERGWKSVLEDFYQPFSERLEAAQHQMEKVELADEPAGVQCEKCGRDMVVRFGRFGKFIACPGFPECRNTRPFLDLIGVQCPQDGGDLVEKRTKGGRIFYGCANYPACDFTSWKRPVATPCPRCGGLLVEENRRTLRCLRCDERTPREALAPQEAETFAVEG